MTSTVKPKRYDDTNPMSIFVAAAGKIYVADHNNNRIVRMDDMSGMNWTAFDQLYCPAGIVVR